MRHIFLFFILIYFSSCRLILGIKEPRPKSVNELNRYLIKHGVDTLNCFTFNKSAFDSIQKLPYKLNWPIGFRPIQFRAFDRQGKMVSQYASCEGSWKKRKVFMEFPPKYKTIADSTISFDKDIKMYKTYNGENLKINCGEYDLSIVVYWATWLGTIDRNLVKAVYKYQRQNPTKKINIIKVNIAETFSPK